MTDPQTRPHLPWRDDYSTGVASIDHEHQQMIDLINRIFERLESDSSGAAVSDFLGEVHARIAAHFALEEQIMRDRRYDQFEDHKADHERLLDEIRDIMDAHEDGTYADRKYAFAERLEDWFVLHFKTKDARLHKRLGHH
jgi:hemerythrin-like metal-binding protein